MKSVLLDKHDRIALLTINRPDKMNALNIETVQAIHQQVTAVRDDADVDVVVLTGAGDRSFVAGADISELHRLTPAEAHHFARYGQEVFSLINGLSKPVIAAVNGFALGGGCELALAAHMRVAAPTAFFGLPEVTLGVIPGYGGTQRLPRLVGTGKAIEMIASGKMVGAEEALTIGLVNRVIDSLVRDERGEVALNPKGKPSLDRDKFLEGVMKFAGQFQKTAQPAVRLALDAVKKGMESSMTEALELEAALFGMVCATDDMKEGTAAFLEKRPARFTGK